MSNSIITTNRAAQAADDAWSLELRRQFGARAGDMRYTLKGSGAPGTRLRELHDAFIAACATWHQALDLKDISRDGRTS